MSETHTYRLRDGIERVVANDITLERGTTVELDEPEAEAINDRREDPVIERAGGLVSGAEDGSGSDEDDGNGGDDGGSD